MLHNRYLENELTLMFNDFLLIYLGIFHLVRTSHFQKTIISYALIRTRGVRNVSFSKRFTHVLNEWPFSSNKWSQKTQIFSIRESMMPNFCEILCKKTIVCRCKTSTRGAHFLFEFNPNLCKIPCENRSTKKLLQQ